MNGSVPHFNYLKSSEDFSNLTKNFVCHNNDFGFLIFLLPLPHFLRLPQKFCWFRRLLPMKVFLKSVNGSIDTWRYSPNAFQLNYLECWSLSMNILFLTFSTYQGSDERSTSVEITLEKLPEKKSITWGFFSLPKSEKN